MRVGGDSELSVNAKQYVDDIALALEGVSGSGVAVQSFLCRSIMAAMPVNP